MFLLVTFASLLVNPCSQNFLCLLRIKLLIAGKSHALHKRVEQLCTRAIRWGELKRKAKVFTLIYAVSSLSPRKLLQNTCAYYLELKMID